MRLIVGSAFLAIMSFLVFSALVARMLTNGVRALILPGIVIGLSAITFGLYHFGFLDAPLWDISMPEVPSEQGRYIAAVRALRGDIANSTPQCLAKPISDWVGKVDYSFGFEGKLALAVRIDSHIVLRSAYLPGDDVQGPGAIVRPSGQFTTLETGQFVHVAGSLPASQNCPLGAGRWRITDKGDIETVFEFAAVQVF